MKHKMGKIKAVCIGETCPVPLLETRKAFRVVVDLPSSHQFASAIKHEINANLTRSGVLKKWQ